ncbi:MAG TPA: ATP-binding protein, partial [Pirellulales bacterium]|nr:ATP-binding protein [Pirellulales bacterium]
ASLRQKHQTGLRKAMNERRRLMILSVSVLTIVSLGAVAITSLHLVPSLSAAASRPVARSLALALGSTAVFVFAGATLLLRISQPLLRRLEASERQLQDLVDTLSARAGDLARANQELDDFTYIASHDLKEPLRGISAYCGMLLEDYRDKLDDNGRRMMGSLVTLCERLSRLIDDLLDYCRAGRTPEARDLELDEVFDGVLATLGPAIDARGGLVRRLGRLPRVRGDARLLGMVLQNLVANGLKFNESRPPVVEVGTVGGEQPTMFVRDNGIGIEPRYHETVFAIFRRLNAREKYEGTGAGLAIARKIVEQHGGRMWLESQAGQGATFYFALPAAATIRPRLRRPSQVAAGRRPYIRT